MARTKQTAKPKFPKKAPKKVYKGKGKNIPLPKKFTVRRFSQGVRCLREIRKAVKAIDLTIPKLPFQRLCRDICDEWKVGLRWKRTALDSLQEAAEDFLIEFYQDAYICAAHAKRVTLMDKDFVTLRRLRYRFSTLLEPVPIKDEKTFNILNIPPWRKPKPEDVGIKIVDVTHERDTRQAKKAEIQKEEVAAAAAREERLQTEISEKAKRIDLEAQLPELLNAQNPEGFIVRAFAENDVSGRDDYISLDRDCMTRLKDRNRELNDTLVLAAMRVAMHDFPPDTQVLLECLDPSICHYLRVEEDILNLDGWVANINFETVELIFIPYNEDSHWSLVAIDLVDNIAYYLNSLPSNHGMCKIKRFLELIQTYKPLRNNLVDVVEHKRIPVPVQEDGHSCGWRVVVNAFRLVNFLYFNEDRKLRFSLDCYNNDHVWLIRANLITYMISINLPLQEPAESSDVVEELSKPSAEGKPPGKRGQQRKNHKSRKQGVSKHEEKEHKERFTKDTGADKKDTKEKKEVTEEKETEKEELKKEKEVENEKEADKEKLTEEREAEKKEDIGELGSGSAPSKKDGAGQGSGSPLKKDNVEEASNFAADKKDVDEAAKKDDEESQVDEDKQPPPS